MKTSHRQLLFVSLFLAVLLLAVAASTAACGGDSQGSLKGYFQQVDEAYEMFEVVGQESGLREYDSVEDFMNNSVIPTYRDFVDALEDINPPAEVELAHEELVAAQAEVLQLFEDSTDRYAALRSVVDLGELLDEPDFEAVDDRALEACRNVREFGRGKGVPHLEC